MDSKGDTSSTPGLCKLISRGVSWLGGDCFVGDIMGLFMRGSIRIGASTTGRGVDFVVDYKGVYKGFTPASSKARSGLTDIGGVFSIVKTDDLELENYVESPCFR